MPLSPDRPLLEEMPGDAARLNVTRLDEEVVDRVRTPLLGLADGRPGRDLRLDLGGLEYLTSTGLGLLLTLHKRVRASGGRLSLCRVSPSVYEVFAVTRLTQVLDVRPQEPVSGPPPAASA